MFYCKKLMYLVERSVEIVNDSVLANFGEGDAVLESVVVDSGDRSSDTELSQMLKTKMKNTIIFVFLMNCIIGLKNSVLTLSIMLLKSCTTCFCRLNYFLDRYEVK